MSGPSDDGAVAVPAVAARVRAALTACGAEYTEPRDGQFAVDLPGERRLHTTCVLEVGRHTVAVHAFVARQPDDNHAAVYRMLLERNLKLSGVAFGVDHNGDIHLFGRIPADQVTPAQVDQLLGTVLHAADSTFNLILRLGFASSIRREWAWRRARGESTANLAAFADLDPTRHPDHGRPPSSAD